MVISGAKVINYSYGHNGMAYALTKTDSEDEKEHELYLKNKAYLDIQTNFMADFLDDLLA